MYNIDVLVGKVAAKKIEENNLDILQCCEEILTYYVGKKAAQKIEAAKQLLLPDEQVTQVKSSRDIYNLFAGLRYCSEEEFWVLCLNRHNKVINRFRVSTGGRYWAMVDTVVLFRKIICTNASNFVVVHNHPSGNSEPSQQDIDLTKKISAGSQILELKLIDHVIIAGENHYSFADNGRL